MAKKQAQKEKKNKSDKKATAPAKKEKKQDKKAAPKATTIKASASKAKVAVPDEKPLVGIKLNDEELKKLRELDDRYAGKKPEVQAAAPEAVKKGAGKKAATK